MTINERIRSFRKEQKLTQQEFASSLDISRSNMGNIETGAVAVTDRIISAISSKYNVNENWLRTGELPMFKEDAEFDLNAYTKRQEASPLEIEMTKAFFSLDKDVRKQILKAFIPVFSNIHDLD